MERRYESPAIPVDTGGVKTTDIELLRRHLAAENAQDMEATLATLSEDCLFDDRALGIQYRGREGARRYYQEWWSAFNIITQPEHRHFTSNGAVISEACYKGIHAGEFLGIPATNRAIRIELAVVITFRDGLMSGEKFYWDVASLLTQLGVNQLPQVLSNAERVAS